MIPDKNNFPECVFLFGYLIMFLLICDICSVTVHFYFRTLARRQKFERTDNLFCLSSLYSGNTKPRVQKSCGKQALVFYSEIIDDIPELSALTPFLESRHEILEFYILCCCSRSRCIYNVVMYITFTFTRSLSYACLYVLY